MKLRVRSNRRTRRGSAIIPVMLTMVALAGMSAAIITTSLFRQSAARKSHEREGAFVSAMTGIDVVLFELQEGLDTGADGIGNASGQMNGANFLVTVDPAFTGPGEYTIQGAGRSGPASQGIELVVTTETTFPFGVFGRDGFSITGTYAVDSYDSTLGTYASQVTGDHAGENADIASNVDIIADGGAVYGDATPGPGFQVLGNPANVTGSTAPATKAETFESFVYAPGIASGGSYSGTSTLATGIFRYDQLNLTGSEVLTIDGDVVLYIDGDILLDGTSSIVITTNSSLTILHDTGDISIGGEGIISDDSLPSSLSLSSATTGSISVAATSTLFGMIYATDAAFDTGGLADIFGAVIAATVDFSGGAMFHFDESLTIPADRSSFRVKSARKVRAEGL